MHTHLLLPLLRQTLRRQGWSNRRLASHFEVGEATVKRWLAGRGLLLERFGELASLCDLTLAELARMAEGPAPGLAHELTLAQERALSTDIFLSFLFMTLLGGTTPEEIAEDFHVPPPQMDAALKKLERLALVDRLGGGRIRPLIDRAIVWRKSPMRALFEQQMKPEFMMMDFAAPEAVYASDVMKLSAQGVATLAEMIEQHRRDVQAMAERDRTETHLPRHWHAMLCAARAIETSRLQQGK